MAFLNKYVDFLLIPVIDNNKWFYSYFIIYIIFTFTFEVLISFMLKAVTFEIEGGRE